MVNVHTKQRTFKKAIIIIGTLLAAMLAGKWLLQGRQRFDCTTLYGRVSYLADNGWEVDAESEELQYVTLPDRLPDVMQSYNELQL